MTLLKYRLKEFYRNISDATLHIMATGIRIQQQEEINRLADALQRAGSQKGMNVLLAELPEAVMQVTIRRFIERKTIRQIATEMQISKPKARNYIHQAIHFLRSKFSPEYFDHVHRLINSKDDLGANY